MGGGTCVGVVEVKFIHTQEEEEEEERTGLDWTRGWVCCTAVEGGIEIGVCVYLPHLAEVGRQKPFMHLPYDFRIRPPAPAPNGWLDLVGRLRLLTYGVVSELCLIFR